MIVSDASALVEILIRSPAASAIQRRLGARDQTLHAPHLIDLEVAKALRRFARTGQIEVTRGTQVLEDFLEVRLIRYPHHPLLPRIWELRHSVSAYDAAYVALAESPDVPLVTRDARLAAAKDHRARIDLL